MSLPLLLLLIRVYMLSAAFHVDKQKIFGVLHFVLVTSAHTICLRTYSKEVMAVTQFVKLKVNN